MTRSLSTCVSVSLTPAGPEVRLIVATHPTTGSAPAIGVERDGTVYELFVSTLPSPAFTASDGLDLYLHRGSCETTLADEDEEHASDRWDSHPPCGQEFAHMLAPWAGNLRLELGQAFSPSDLRPTECAPEREAKAPATDAAEPAQTPAPATVYGPPQWARPSFPQGFPGSVFPPHPDGTLRCPAEIWARKDPFHNGNNVPFFFVVCIGHDPEKWRQQTWFTHLLVSRCLKRSGTEISQGRVQPHRIVKALQILKNGLSRLLTSLKLLSVNTLLLKCCKK